MNIALRNEVYFQSTLGYDPESNGFKVNIEWNHGMRTKSLKGVESETL